MTVSVCVVVTMSVYGVLAKHYKLRARNQVINIYSIVEAAYDTYMEQSQQYQQLHDKNGTVPSSYCTISS